VNQEEQNVRAQKKEKRIEEVYLLRSKIKNGKPKRRKGKKKICRHRKNEGTSKEQWEKAH
jgi:hypothetical protein